MVNASAGTGASSRRPRICSTWALVCSVVPGTIRSTIAFGKETFSAIHDIVLSSTPAAWRNSVTIALVVLPADCMLSQDSTVTGALDSWERLTSPQAS